MTSLDETDMNLGHMIAKWEYGAYAFTIAAQLESCPAVRVDLAKEAVRDAQYARELIEWGRQQAAKGASYYRDLRTDLEINEEGSRISYIIALGLAIEAKAGEDVTTSIIEEELGGLSDSFTKTNPPSWNPWFKPYRLKPRHR